MAFCQKKAEDATYQKYLSIAHKAGEKSLDMEFQGKKSKGENPLNQEQKEKDFDRAYIVLTPQNGFLKYQHDERMDLKEMQDLVGGYIEIAPTMIPSHWAGETGVSIRMVVDAEGETHGLDWNPKATTLCGYLARHIAGNALIVGDKYGKLRALKRSAAEEIMRVFHLEHKEIKESGLAMTDFFKKAEEEGKKA